MLEKHFSPAGKLKSSLRTKQGICEISFYPSGQAALRSMIPVTVPSETIRDMIGWVVDACVGKAGTGGFVTRYINRTTAFLDNPDSNLDWYGQRKDCHSPPPPLLPIKTRFFSSLS